MIKRYTTENLLHDMGLHLGQRFRVLGEPRTYQITMLGDEVLALHDGGGYWQLHTFIGYTIDTEDE